MRFIYLLSLLFFTNFLYAQTLTANDTLANDTTDIADAPDIDPEFTGGYEKLSTYIGKELKWDEVEKWTAKKKLPEKNRIVVRFVVEKDGSLSHVHVESASAYCPPCNKEAIRVIQAMPAWTPGYKYDRPVRTWVRIPIIFDMKSER
ncbi:MAG: hypothetical protein RL751_808 [Bacteroidota bacterium]|jgi:TonB family protein